MLSSTASFFLGEATEFINVLSGYDPLTAENVGEACKR
jgi:hypothetical protein